MCPDPKALSELVRDLHRQGRPWLPAGLGSRLDWGPPLAGSAAVVSCAALNRIVDFEPGDFTITVEAGVPLLEVQQLLASHGQWLSLDLPWGSGPAGSVGGLMARGLAGGFRQRYLGVRDQLIGLRLMRADGVAAHAGGRVVKNVAGYDLMRLFTGSWGSLGLITELSLRTMPLPPQRRGLIVQGPIPRLRPLAQWLLSSTLAPERVDWWSGSLAARASLSPRPMLLIALASVDAGTLVQQTHAIRHQTDLPIQVVEGEELEQLIAIGRNGCGKGVPRPCWLLRLAVTPQRAAELLLASELEGMMLELAAESGLGMAWCDGEITDSTHPCRTAGDVAVLRQRCRQLGGYLTVLRQPEAGELPAWEDASSRFLIERVKDQFDPSGLLAPGRLPGVAQPQGAAGAEPGVP